MPNNVFKTGVFEIPDQQIEPWLTKVKGGSTVATLTPATPQAFGKGHAISFDIGEAEYVEPGAAKGPTSFTKSSMSTYQAKFHKTVRFDQEVIWADEAEQASLIQGILDQIQPALSRALDFMTIHGINPVTGERVAVAETALVDSASSITVGSKAYESLDAADIAVIGAGYTPSAAALDPAFAAGFLGLRDTNGRKLYPDLALATAASVLEGHTTSVSRTVRAKGVAKTDSKLLGLVGDFSTVRWGVQKAIGLDLIAYGDPDGLGDLKRHNQVAMRAEVVYGIGIADVNAVAKIVAA